MPFNGSGTYTPPGADFPAVTGTTISSLKFNNTINDIASALTGVLIRDGQSPMTGTLPMGGQIITGLGAGTVSAPALSFTSDTDTGVYKPGAAQWAVAIDGTQRLLVNATGISGDGSQLTALSGTQVTTGTIPVARLNGGTTAQFVRGDGAYSSTLTGGLTLGDSLTVNGAVARRVEIQDSGNSNRGGYLRTGASAFLLSSNSGVISTAIGQDGTTIIEVDTNKRVQIYASTPGSNPLTANSNIAGDSWISHVNANVAGNSGFQTSQTGGVTATLSAVTNTIGYVGTTTNHAFGLYSNNTLRATIGSTGGITIATPTSGPSLSFAEATTQIIPGATALAFKNNANSATNFRISDGGVLTNPRSTQTAFHGYTSATRTTTGVFAGYSELYDRGSGFDPSTGIYTVPTTGLYIVTVEIYVSCTTATSVFDVRLRQGGVTSLLMSALSLAVSGGVDVRTMVLTRTLTAGTTLDVYLNTISGGTSPSAIINSFTAYLLS